MLYGCDGDRARPGRARRHAAAVERLRRGRLAARARRPGSARGGAAELARAPRAVRGGPRSRLPPPERARHRGAAAPPRCRRETRRVHRRPRGARTRRARTPRRVPADRGARGGAGRARAAARSAPRRTRRPHPGGSRLVAMERPELNDRRLEAVLERLDRLVAELERLNRRQESREELTVIAHELRNLNESLQALAYAALGREGPQVRRRRTG